MTRRLISRILVGWLCVQAPCVCGQGADDLTPTETIKLLEAIETLQEKVHGQRYGIHASSIQAFRSAAASTTAAYDFYMKCYREMRFERRDAREAEWRAWRDKNIKYLRSKEHSEARRLQLEYLVLTLQAAQFKKPEEEMPGMVPKLVSLIDACLARYEKLGSSRKILHENALGSIYAEVYDLPATLGRFKDWGKGPLDIDGIYEKVIFPLYRTPDKAGQLASFWDKRIVQETNRVAAVGSPEAEERFKETSLPRLRWSRGMDLLKLGKRREALTGLVALAQKNANHDDIDSWLEILSGVLSGEIDPTAMDFEGSGS